MPLLSFRFLVLIIIVSSLMRVPECTAFSVIVPACRGVGTPSNSIIVCRAETDNDNDEDRELVPARRRRGGRRYYDEEETMAAERQDGRSNKRPYYEDDLDDDDDEDLWDDLDQVVDDLLDQEEEYDLFGNELIPNPILDSIDPDGAAERFPELARDPRFWIDMVLFIAFLNFLSDIGPRDFLPDIPLY